MGQNFIDSRREQGFLLPPDVRDWLPADHLVWFVIDAVASMDLAAFYGAYRADGHGRAAYEPSMMVTLLMFSYSMGCRSSRAIERHCRQDIAYRVITGNAVPDHATVARFVVRHEAALAGLFTEVLKLCDQAGLVKPGLIAIDGTRLPGNASPEANREFDQIALEILAEHKATDDAEDEEHGDARGDELPEHLSTPEGRREFLRQAKRQDQDTDTLEPEPHPEPEPEGDGETDDGGGLEFDIERIIARGQGREGWLRDARRQLEQQRWQDPDLICRSRAERLLLAIGRLEADLAAERAGNEAYQRYRAAGRMKDGRRFGGPPKPYTPPQIPAGKVNVTDPDSKRIKTYDGYVQGYNAQTVVGEGQIVLAAEITNSGVDWSQLAPMVTATTVEFERAGVSGVIETAVADAQYWNEEHIDEVIANQHIQVVVPPDGGANGKQRAGWTGGRYTFMRQVLASDHGRQLYRKRQHMIEPVFGHTKHNRGITSFHRRGRTAVRTEWRLVMATHNLTKLHRHTIATQSA